MTRGYIYEWQSKVADVKEVFYREKNLTTKTNKEKRNFNKR